MPRSFSPSIACLILVCSQATRADELSSPVDSSVPLKLISDDFGLADGPAWDGSWALYVPDVKQALIKRYVPAKDTWSIVRKGTAKYSASIFSHGQLFVSNNSEARIQTFAGGNLKAVHDERMVIDDAPKPKKRPNDLVVDHFGGVYFTLTGQNQVVYVSPEGESRVVTEAVQSPNGITMSPDNKTLYVAAYRPKKIIALPIEAPGKLGPADEFAAMDDGDALGADGMAIDRAGNVYCAGATDVWIWNPDGKLLDKIACPTRPINCTFGDQDMRSLYITGFGGVYLQRMKSYGIAPQPPVDSKLLRNESTPDTSIPDSISAHLNVVYAQYGSRKVLTDIFVPKAGDGPLPTLVVVHGGGWLKGDKNKFRALAIELAKRGFVTAAIEYRLGDEALFPAGIHDCNAAVRFLRANAAKYRIDTNNIGAVGGSAGGHLVGLMAAGGANPRLQGDGGNSSQSSKIQLSIVMAGPLQMTTGSVAERSVSGKNSNSNQWLGKTIAEDRSLYELADAHLQISSDTCPIYFLTGELDNPERNALSREKLKSLGIETGLITYKDGKHGCWNRKPWLKQFADDIDRLARKHLSTK